MFIKRFLGFSLLILTLVGCTQRGEWYSEYGQIPPQEPSEMQTDFYYPELNVYGTEPIDEITVEPKIEDYQIITEHKDISVLLPLSGPNAELGKSISQSIEIAFLQNPDKNISVTFFDLSGNKIQKQSVISHALSSNPDIIIGPIFAEDAQLIRNMKPESLPVLSFTSDTNAFGYGVMTMALIPAQSVEAIVKEMSTDNLNRTIIFAPDTESGKFMAGAAVLAANIYDIPVAGLFYYTEGNSDSIKQVAKTAAMYDARSAANTKAREILSDILVKEKLTTIQNNSISTQLEKLSKTETIGQAPYDAVLFLGNATDTKTVVSFLRYFNVGSRDAKFYGTAMWDTPELLNDFNMAGAKFASLPAMSPEFTSVYEHLSNNTPTRLNTFGFDAANLVRGMVYSHKSQAAYLLDPSGYIGLDGLFRLRPNGTSELTLQISKLHGNGKASIVKSAKTDFLKPIYSIQSRQISPANSIDLTGEGINPMDYITIPEYLKNKYHSKTFGTNTKSDTTTDIPEDTEVTTILPETEDEEVVTSPEFKPVSLDTVDKKLIDSLEVTED